MSSGTSGLSLTCLPPEVIDGSGTATAAAATAEFLDALDLSTSSGMLSKVSKRKGCRLLTGSYTYSAYEIIRIAVYP